MRSTKDFPYKRTIDFYKRFSWTAASGVLGGGEAVELVEDSVEDAVVELSDEEPVISSEKDMKVIVNLK